MENNLTDDAVSKLLGQRLAKYRLNRNLTQKQLAEEAGVAVLTIARLERGDSTQLSTLIRVLRVLDLLGNIDALVPEPPPSPIQQVKLKGKTRRRASGSRATREETKPGWVWKDDA